MKNQLIDLSVREFLDRVAGNDPVPGGGSVSAFYGALGAALGSMVAGLTVGKKKYVAVNDFMEEALARLKTYQSEFLHLIDKDSEAYNKVFSCFKLPKDTDEEKALRSQAIQEGTLYAAQVPLEIAQKAVAIMGLLEEIVAKGNQNAVTDACIAMMSARNAALGAALNVRINLGGLKDKAKAEALEAEVAALEQEALSREEQVRHQVHQNLQL